MKNALHMLIERGVIEQISDAPALEKSLNTETVTLYAGFDPTADSLHLGHLFPVLCLARFQRLGHCPISLIGGATAMIGDPSGRIEERRLMGEDIIEANSASIKKQLERFLDFDGSNAAIMVNNADWTKDVSYLAWLRDIGKQFDCAVIACAQMNREHSGRGRATQPRPQLSDLRDSGKIEENADNVWMLYAAVDGQSKPTDQTAVDFELWVRKARNGQRDVLVKLIYNRVRQWIRHVSDPEEA